MPPPVSMPFVLKPEEEKVFSALRMRKAMPVLEIAGITGIYGPRLQGVIDQLVQHHLVTVTFPPQTSAFDGIVTISGKYF